MTHDPLVDRSVQERQEEIRNDPGRVHSHNGIDHATLSRPDPAATPDLERRRIESWQDRRVVVVIAHPDDEVLGAGATIHRLARSGADISIHLPFRRCDPRGVHEWPRLIDAFHASCERLGATAVVADRLIPETEALSRPDRIHDLILPAIEEADIVLTHWYGDTHQVHRGLCYAIEIGTRPFRRRRDLWLFEVPSSTDQSFSTPFQPTCYVQVDRCDVEAKCEAMEYYPMEEAPGRRARDLERLAGVRGCQIGVEYAECFSVARQFL